MISLIKGFFLKNVELTTRLEIRTVGWETRGLGMSATLRGLGKAAYLVIAHSFTEHLVITGD